jgi:hypothetical protein
MLLHYVSSFMFSFSNERPRMSKNIIVTNVVILLKVLLHAS